MSDKEIIIKIRKRREIEDYIIAEDDVAESNGDKPMSDEDMVTRLACIYCSPWEIFKAWWWVWRIRKRAVTAFARALHIGPYKKKP